MLSDSEIKIAPSRVIRIPTICKIDIFSFKKKYARAVKKTAFVLKIEIARPAIPLDTLICKKITARNPKILANPIKSISFADNTSKPYP